MFLVVISGFLSLVLPALVLFSPSLVPVWRAIANVAMGIVGLIVTVGLKIPRHNNQYHCMDDRLIQEMISNIWPRTASITVLAALTLAMCIYAFTPV